jgi:hypothetical protein
MLNTVLFAEWAPRISLTRTLGNSPFNQSLVKDIYLMGELNHFHNRRGSNTVKVPGMSMDLRLPEFLPFRLQVEKKMTLCFRQL